MQIYRFRNCLLNAAERSVVKDNACLELTTKTFDVLQYLVENAGKVLTKDEILGTVWNGDFVEESNLPVHISKLRKSLNETLDNRFIETVQGTGYRFVAPVRLVNQSEWFRSAGSEPAAARTSAAGTTSLSSIAVLPFDNQSEDSSSDYLTDGFTEGLINGLTHTPGLKVIARNTVFRYRKTGSIEFDEIRDTLGVSNLLTGRVRVEGERLTVGVELIDAHDGTQRWGKQYYRNFSEIVSLQDEITFAVAEKLNVMRAQTKKPFSSAFTRNAESYRYYLKGKFFFEKRSGEDLLKAIDYFSASVRIDPDNVHSYAELVDCYRLLHLLDFISYSEFWERSRPVLAELRGKTQSIDIVQVMYCDLRMLEWRFVDAAKHCRRALMLNPNSLKGRLRYSDLLLQSRNISEALEQLEKIMTIDPLSPLTHIRTARLFYIAGKYENAVAYLNDALELEPGNFEALALRGGVKIETGELDEALVDLEASLEVEHQPDTLAMVGVVYAKQGKKKKSYEVIRLLKALSQDSSRYAIKLAHVYLALGETDKTFVELETAICQHEPDLRALTYDPRWAAIRNEAKFGALVRRVGLPDLEIKNSSDDFSF
jgi:TolB-like protein/Tfp pilus assembly protein PilF